MERTLLIGCGGSGKSTLARQMAECSGLPVIHLDRHFWKPMWVATPKAQWAETVRELTEQPQWIMDGNYGGTMAQRMEACDSVVFLDRPRWLCLSRIAKRRWRFSRFTSSGSERPDMAPECPERLTLQFLHYVWLYRRTRRPGILALLEGLPAEKRVFVLQTQAEIDTFLHQYCSEVGHLTTSTPH